jgi:hypothetical protein
MHPPIIQLKLEVVKELTNSLFAGHQAKAFSKNKLKSWFYDKKWHFLNFIV